MLSDSRYQAEDILESINYLKDQGGKEFNLDDLYEFRKFYKGKPKVIGIQKLFKIKTY